MLDRNVPGWTTWGNELPFRGSNEHGRRIRIPHTHPQNNAKNLAHAAAQPAHCVPSRKLRYTKWLNLRQLLELSGHEMGCSSEGFGLKMTHKRHAQLRIAAVQRSWRHNHWLTSLIVLGSEVSGFRPEK